MVPAMGDSITEGSVAAVLKQPGEHAAAGRHARIHLLHSCLPAGCTAVAALCAPATRVCATHPPNPHAHNNNTIAECCMLVPTCAALATLARTACLSCLLCSGDTVQEDDVVAQIETDKVTIDVKFTGKSGKITSLAVAEGDTVVVGQKVAEFEEGDFGGGSSTAAAAAAPEPEPAAAAAPPTPKQQPAAAAAPPPPPPPKPQAPPAPKVGLKGHEDGHEGAGLSSRKGALSTWRQSCWGALMCRTGHSCTPCTPLPVWGTC